MEMVETIAESLQRSAAEESKESSDAAELLLNLRVDNSKEAKAAEEVLSAADSTKPEDVESTTQVTKGEEQPKE